MSAFAAPRLVKSPTDCFFYHRFEVPGYGVLGGDWDLRNSVDQYLGNVDFRGKRVLDMGAASGFLTFEMEKRGAEVVSYDIRTGSDWDIVPHYKLRNELREIRRKADVSINQLKNAYWFCHREYDSKAKAVYANIYDLPEIGEFDVVVYGLILTHLRDPFQALYQGARLSKKTVIVTGSFSLTENPQSTFRPNAADTSNLGVKGWWLLSIGTIRRMLGVLGFEIAEVVTAKVECLAAGSEGPRDLQAIVAHRVAD